jgi:hypothetical protein
MEKEAKQFLFVILTDGNSLFTVWTHIDVVHTSYTALLHTTLCLYINWCVSFSTKYFFDSWFIFYMLDT